MGLGRVDGGLREAPIERVDAGLVLVERRLEVLGLDGSNEFLLLCFEALSLFLVSSARAARAAARSMCSDTSGRRSAPRPSPSGSRSPCSPPRSAASSLSKEVCDIFDRLQGVSHPNYSEEIVIQCPRQIFNIS